MAIANEDKAQHLAFESLGLINYVINILQTTDATFSQLENALWVLQNLLSDFETANLLIEQNSILDYLVQFAN